MKNIYSKVALCLLFLILTINTKAQKTSPLFTDNQGILRNTSDGKEVAYYGTNYTLPFAHSYRAAQYLGVNRKTAIDIDVYHMARLGLNAFRLHLWDVEISDKDGNILENDHLDMLDYLVMKLKQRKIDIVFTAQTNFGNGYPERNINTGAYSYLYDKCMIHSDTAAIKAQQNYIKQLVNHVNPYTGKSYKDDPSIVAFEINNEPCHSVSIEDTENYINAMIEALKSTDCKKPIFYNVSHNHDFVSAYFKTPIDGTTYQWYPTGLVGGYTKNINFLPYIDSYDIDFKDVENFDKKAKIIYEFDPADVLSTYLFPAIARSLKTAGFQWITQFAYDAMFLAQYNTDYQTHYLNIIYTPGKAIGMKIAAEVTKKVPLYQQFEPYPEDTTFYGTTVSYSRNLAEYNADGKFFYTNNTNDNPENLQTLTEICGVGSSPVVKYTGTGAYFLDKLENGMWRLEIMPDVIIVNDPFEKPSLNRKVAITNNTLQEMEINLPDLAYNFDVETLSPNSNPIINGNKLKILPGVYILTPLNGKKKNKKKITYPKQFKVFSINEYYVPNTIVDKIYCKHTDGQTIEKGKDFELKATIVAPQKIDSVVVYPGKVSFWNKNNPSLKLNAVSTYEYSAILPNEWLHKGIFNYYIMVYSAGKCTTFPDQKQGNPLDWDFTPKEKYSLNIEEPNDKIVLIKSAFDDKKVAVYGYPQWGKTKIEPEEQMPYNQNVLKIHNHPTIEEQFYIISKDIKPQIENRTNKASQCKKLCVKFSPLTNTQTFRIGITLKNGITFSAEKTVSIGKDYVEILLSDLQQTPTPLLAEAYPVFLKKEFSSSKKFDFDFSVAETFFLCTEKTKKGINLGIVGAWAE